MTGQQGEAAPKLLLEHIAKGGGKAMRQFGKRGFNPSKKRKIHSANKGHWGKIEGSRLRAL
jgi:hypothetical protein